MANSFSEFVFPLLILLMLSVSLIKKKDTIQSFVSGAKDGFSAIVSITPNILAIMLASAIFRHSGALSWLLKVIAPVIQKIGIPQGITELILLRPISGSGAMVLLSDVLNRFGADSYEGILASVICASTETTLYTVMVYFGVTKVKDTKLPLIIGLLCDVIVLILSILMVKFTLFGS